MNTDAIRVTLQLGSVQYRGFVEPVKRFRRATKEQCEKFAAQRRERFKLMLAKHPELRRSVATKTDLAK